MDEEIIMRIPGFIEAEEFYDYTLRRALTNCQASGKEAMFVPEIVDAKIALSADNKIWKRWYTTTSIKATGTTKQGNRVVVFAHVPNYLCNPENIKNGAGEIPQEEFQRLLNLEDKQRVFVIDYNTLKKSKSGIFNIEEALKHPWIIPSLGGEGRAKAYLEKYEQVKSKTYMVWHDYNLDEKPTGQFLAVCNYDYTQPHAKFDQHNFGGRFLGMKFKPSTLETSISVAIECLQNHQEQISTEEARKLLNITNQVYQTRTYDFRPQ